MLVLSSKYTQIRTISHPFHWPLSEPSEVQGIKLDLVQVLSVTKSFLWSKSRLSGVNTATCHLSVCIHLLEAHLNTARRSG